jgi:hypothetical protein
MSHPYSHDSHDAAGPSSTHQTVAGSHDLCNECLAYAPLLAAAGASGVLPFVEPQGRGLAMRTTADSLVDLSLTLAFRSRAPPDTL